MSQTLSQKLDDFFGELSDLGTKTEAWRQTLYSQGRDSFVSLIPNEFSHAQDNDLIPLLFTAAEELEKEDILDAGYVGQMPTLPLLQPLVSKVSSTKKPLQKNTLDTWVIKRRKNEVL